MRLQKIAELCSLRLDIFQHLLTNPEIHDFRLVEKGQKFLKKDILYLGRIEDFLSCHNLTEESQNCFILTKNPAGLPPDFNSVNYLTAGDTEMIPDIINALHDIFTECATMDGYRKTVTLFKSESLMELLRNAYTMVSNPVILLNYAKKVLACSCCASTPQEMNARIREWSNYIATNFEYDSAEAEEEAVYKVRLKNGTHEALVKPVFFDNSFSGFLLEIDMDQKLEAYHREILHLTAKIIAANFSKSNIFIQEHADSGVKDAYYQLLSGESQDFFSSAMMEGGSQYQCVTVCRRPTESNTYIRLVSAFEKLPETVAFPYKDYVVAFTATSADVFGESVYSRLEKGWQAICDNNGVDIGISEPFSPLKDVRFQFNRALTALSYGDYFRVEKENVLSFYDNCRFYEALKNVSPDHLLRNYCAPVLTVLRAYDEQNKTEYFNTLRMFVLCERNYKEAAMKLNIHKNTLYYRIEQIEKLYYDKSVWDPEFFFTLSSSFRIYDYCQKKIRIMDARKQTQ